MRPIVDAVEANARFDEINESIWYFLHRLKAFRNATSTAALNDKAEAKLKEAILCGENFYNLVKEAHGWNLTKEN